MDKDFTKKIDDFLSSDRLPFRDSHEVAREKVLSRISSEGRKVVPINKGQERTRILAIAASLALLIAVGWGYTSETVSNETASIISYELPDGSSVNMKASSRLSFHPWAWSFDRRELDFEGTGFFQVKEGSKFTVVTPRGEVSVLGTSFSIINSDYGLRVSCKTGKVMVEDETGNQTILHPGEGVEIRPYKTELFRVPPKDIDGWLRGKYVFENAKLSRVLNVVEDITGMDVKSNVDVNMVFSGTLSDLDSNEELLEIICKPLGLKYEIDLKEEKIIIQKS